MTDPARLRQELLELGLEDWIPLPEGFDLVASLGSEHPKDDSREALTGLTRQGQLRWWRGPWDCEEEHIEVASEDVEALLADPRWYRWNVEGDGDRLYFVNVENIKPGI